MIFSYHGASLQNSLSWGIRQHTKTLTGWVTLKTIMSENTELPQEDNRGKAAGEAFFFFPDDFGMLSTCTSPRISNAYLLTLFKINTLPLRQECHQEGKFKKWTTSHCHPQNFIISYDWISGRKAAHASWSQQVLSEVGGCQVARKKAHTRFPAREG